MAYLEAFKHLSHFLWRLRLDDDRITIGDMLSLYPCGEF